MIYLGVVAKLDFGYILIFKSQRTSAIIIDYIHSGGRIFKHYILIYIYKVFMKEGNYQIPPSLLLLSGNYSQQHSQDWLSSVLLYPALFREDSQSFIAGAQSLRLTYQFFS